MLNKKLAKENLKLNIKRRFLLGDRLFVILKNTNLMSNVNWCTEPNLLDVLFLLH